MKIFLLFFAGLALCQGGNYDYGEVIRLSLLFYEAQRSGKLPADQKVTWRKDSALGDKGQNGEDLTGGYYDAGDYIKFTFALSSTLTVLSWGIIDHQEGYEKANALEDARKAVKWGTDYLLKCHVSEHVLYGQVGDGDLDHNSWGRPEDMTMERPAFKIDEDHPGTELAAETAAALAAAAIVFRTADPTYSSTLATHAEQLFKFADDFRGNYSKAIYEPFYTSSGYEDELVWAGAWLFLATDNEWYLQRAEDLYTEFHLSSFGRSFSWDQKISGIEVLLAIVTKTDRHVTRAKDYCDYMVNQQQKTPKGLVYIVEWGTLGIAANAAFLCLRFAAADYSPEEYRAFGKSQIDYMLGDAGRSFVVGYGVNPPTHAHHKSSSCPDAPAVCDWDTFNGDQPNAHVLYGGLVGGPDQNDVYNDVRPDYVHNEVAILYNAGLQSALAALQEL